MVMEVHSPILGELIGSASGHDGVLLTQSWGGPWHHKARGNILLSLHRKSVRFNHGTSNLTILLQPDHFSKGPTCKLQNFYVVQST